MKILLLTMRRFRPSPSPIGATCLACGLGHAADLTAIQAVIQHRIAASLPTGRGTPSTCHPERSAAKSKDPVIGDRRTNNTP